MTAIRLVLTSSTLGLSLLGTACQNNDHSSGTRHEQATLPAPKQMNKDSAEAKLREAQQAEADGKYTHALECYEQLRAYPEASRPKDLDDRIKRIEARMKAQQ
jgi:hypothetical protein